MSNFEPFTGETPVRVVLAYLLQNPDSNIEVALDDDAPIAVRVDQMIAYLNRHRQIATYE